MKLYHILLYSLLSIGLLAFACNNSSKRKGDTSTNATETTTVQSPPPTVSSKGSGGISAVKALQQAEAFVAAQGYTDAAVDYQQHPITYEKGEFATDTSSILEFRKNTLESKAMGARQYGKNFSWAVGFRQIPYENNTVRVVVMDSLGKNMKIAPQNMREDWIMGLEAQPSKDDETGDE